MGADKCWLSDSGMIMTKSMSILKIHLFHVCMCSCEHLTRGKWREPNHSIHESMWYYGAGGGYNFDTACKHGDESIYYN